MGPRSIDRGILGRPSEGGRLATLQWGRDQLIAEFSATAPTWTSPDWLQWGRDQLIAELGIDNGIRRTLDLLQWGRDQLIAELADARIVHVELDRFNGAAIN